MISITKPQLVEPALTSETHAGLQFVFRDVGTIALMERLTQFCLEVETHIVTLEPNWPDDVNDHPTTSRKKSYNFLSYDHPGLKALAVAILDAYTEYSSQPCKDLWVECWLNVHREGAALPKHSHPGYLAAGHLGVCTDDSSTVYVGDRGQEIEIPAKNGRLTLFGGDEHFVTPWSRADTPRVSVAFNLLPGIVARKYDPTTWRQLSTFS